MPGLRGHLLHAQCGEHEEPDHHDRPEEPAHRTGAEPLEREERDQDHQRERDDLRRQSGRRHVSPDTADTTEMAGVSMPSP